MFLSKKKLLTGLTALLCVCSLRAQTPYWQQRVDYTIDVSLNDQQHTLDAFARIIYYNQSPDTLHYIWFHLWPNAYKNDKTALSDQLLENGSTRFYFATQEERGYINRLDFKVNDQHAETADHPNYIDIIRLMLPTPLPPGQKVTITTPFHVKLPEVFSRSGHEGQRYQITQWYPKPAVYDRDGWHPLPYLDQGEFYSNFGTYDVHITLPSNYVVAATGQLMDESEKNWLSGRSGFEWIPERRKEKARSGAIKTVTEKFPPSASTQKTLHFREENVLDFAWFADKRFRVLQDTCRLDNGSIVSLSSYFIPAEAPGWEKSLTMMRQSLLARSRWLGNYPYSTLSIVQGPSGNGGGMEYPSIALIGPNDSEGLLHYTISHEIGHNWFQAIVGSNERSYPWMDEGLNSFYDNRYSTQIGNGKGEVKFGKQQIPLHAISNALVETSASLYRDQPIATPADSFSQVNYNLDAYAKTAMWLEYLQQVMGTAAFDAGMKSYVAQWQFKHPAPADFKVAMEKAAGHSLDSAFSLLQATGPLPYARRKGTQAGFPLSPAFWSRYFKNRPAHTLLLSPAIGMNTYDKLMVGALVTNMGLPMPRFSFLLAPLYATGTSRLAGNGFINYSIYPKQALFYRIDAGVSAAAFSINDFTTPENKKLHFGFHKIVPSLRFTFDEKNARSTRERYIQLKSYFITEQGLRYSRDSVFTGTDTLLVDNYGKRSANRTLLQLKAVWQNFRALYPYKAEFKLEQGTDFVRAAFTGHYFFNYANGGGLNARFFAGKFFYTSSKTFSKQFATDRYHLNMTGANGQEDYTYSDYFAGRNEFDGWASQQIMERDGAFKTRTDMLAEKVGRTDDWLIALNFSTTIPDQVNPLNLLPFRIPLKVFADVGTYAEAWKRNANTDRFLFDAGLQIPLFKEVVNIYLPLIYSRPFKDYIQSTIPKNERLLRRISFSIDFSNFSLRKINRNLGF
ncbi:MAG: M1 family metallopeptidase [Sphingobacteriales bacterium]|nr:M1 family metallopeptidase [Sphingobacteriales bacterium]OJW34049.1 MAG: hypothetical protein BGO54_05090 [Sphingobacteriales bacterium 46-32]